MDIIENLEKVKSLLSDENKWTKGYMAADSQNNATEFDDDNACKWCLVGAVHRAVPDIMETHDIFRVLRNITGVHAAKYNDRSSTEYTDIIGLLNEAIAIEN